MGGRRSGGRGYLGQGPADIAASAVTAGLALVRDHLHPVSVQVPHLYHVYILGAPHTPHAHIPHKLPNTPTHTGEPATLTFGGPGQRRISDFPGATVDSISLLNCSFFKVSNGKKQQGKTAT